jgi:hypothetical protein
MRSFGRRRSSIRRNVSTKLAFRILSIVPSGVLAGAGATTISVNGVGFPPSAIIYIDGVAQTTTYVSAFLLQCTVAAGITAVPGFKSIRVFDALGHGSNTVSWPVSFPVPTLATVTPAFGFLGEGAVPVSGTGTGIYNPGTEAAVDGDPVASTYGSPTTIIITVPVTVVDGAGDHAITLSNPEPGGGASGSKLFQARYRAPSATALSVAVIPIDSGDFGLTVTGATAGTKFYRASDWPDGGSQGFVDNVPVTTTYTDATHVVVTVPAAVTSSPGTKAIKITNPTIGGGGGTSATLNVQVSAPSVVSLDSVSRVRGFDAFSLTVTGTSFLSTDAVMWGATPLTTTFVNATTLRATVTSALLAIVGTAQVGVRTATGFNTNTLPFDVTAWTFGDIGTPLRLWLDGTSLMDDGTGRASSWNDLSSYGHHLTQSASGNRPLIMPSVGGFNGQPGAFFTGSRPDFVSGIPWLVSGPDGLIQKLSYNIWVVGGATAASQSAANPTPIGCDNGQYVLAAALDTNLLQALDSSGTATAVNSTFTWDVGATWIFRQRKTAGSLYARTNRGAELSAVHGTNPAAFTPNNILVGRRLAASGAFTGFLGCVLITDSDLSYTHKSQIDNVLSSLYGTTFGTLGTLAVPTSCSPNTATQFDLPFTITVTGTGFTSGDFVNIDGFVLATTFVNATTLTASVTAAVLATSGRKNVTVANVNGISGPVRLDIAPYVPGVGPNLTSVSPNTATRYDDAFTITCTGSNFTATCVVKAGTTSLVTIFDSVTQVRATVTASVLYTNGTKAITVVDGATSSSAQNLTVANWGILDIPTLSTWFRADVVTTSGSAVTQWDDQSGNGYHVVQATSTKQPALITSDPNFNGRPSIDFDGTADTLLGTIAASPNILANAAWSTGVVYRADTIPTNGIPPVNVYNNASLIGLSATGYFTIVLANAPAMYGVTGDASNRSWVTNTAVAATATQQCFWRRSVALNSAELSINGGALATTTTLSPNISTQTLAIGSNLGGNYFNGQIAEAWTAKTRVSDTVLTRWNNYCRDRYGL